MIWLSQAALRKYWRVALPLGVVLVTCLMVLLAPFFSPTISDTALKPYLPDVTSEYQPAPPPPDEKIVAYEFTAEYRLWQIPSVSVRTNGCLFGIAVDGKPGDMQAIPPRKRCAKLRNLSIDLGDSLHYGTQRVLLLVRHNANQPLIAEDQELIRTSLSMQIQITMLGVMIGCLLWSVWLYRMERVLALMLLAALCIYTGHAISTWHYHASYDLGGHLNYIRYVGEQGWRPPPLQDNITRHPPLYYWGAAVAYHTAQAIDAVQPWQWVRMVSVACFMVYLVYGLRIIELLLVRKDWLYYLACALFVFWPNNLLTAVRINNDLLMYAFYAAAVYYLLRWRASLAHRDMMLALLAVAGGMFAKLSMMGIAIFFAFIVGEKLYKRAFTPAYALNRRVMAAGAVLLLSLVFGIGYNAWSGFTRQGDAPLASVPLGPPLSASLDTLITTDMIGLSRSPFLSGDSERRHIVNYFIKTALFGDFIWEKDRGADAMLTAWLVMLALMVVYACCHIRKDLADNAAVWALLLASLIPYFGFRLMYATFPTQDFRYIYPMLIPIFVFWVYSVRFYEEKHIPVVKYATALAGALIVVLAIPFMLRN